MIRIKSIEEIDRIRESCQLLKRAFEVLEEALRVGITPQELDAIARAFITKHKAKPAFLGYEGFPAALCVSVNDEVIHGIPSKTPLQEGDLVSFDLGINLHGYFSDMAKTFGVGCISQKHQTLLEATQKSLFKGIEAAVVGHRVKDISQAVSETIAPYGFGIVYDYCGHGVGLSIHEDPQIPNNYPWGGPNPRLREGMVLAIEPMINEGKPEVYVDANAWTVKTKDHSVSAHFEHTIALFADHTEILTL